MGMLLEDDGDVREREEWAKKTHRVSEGDVIRHCTTRTAPSEPQDSRGTTA